MSQAAPRPSPGRKIRELRKRRKLTRDELAERAGIHCLDLARIEKGERQVDLDTLVRIFQLLEGTDGGGATSPQPA